MGNLFLSCYNDRLADYSKVYHTCVINDILQTVIKQKSTRGSSIHVIYGTAVKMIVFDFKIMLVFFTFLHQK